MEIEKEGMKRGKRVEGRTLKNRLEDIERDNLNVAT